MVIHDMRNPTASIKLGLEETAKKLAELDAETEDHKSFQEKCQNLLLRIIDSNS